MINNIVAVLDACVLYPAPLRDLLISLAADGQYQGKWTNEIHDEWIRNLLRNRPDLSSKLLEKTRDEMNVAVLDSLISDYENLIDELELPDSNDRHVLASAIYVSADAIITFNLKDFPNDYLSKFDVKAIHPDEFVNYLFDNNSLSCCECINRQRNRLKNPPITAEKYITIIENQSLPKFANLLKQYKSYI